MGREEEPGHGSNRDPLSTCCRIVLPIVWLPGYSSIPARKFSNLAIPVKNTGKDQHATPDTLRHQFSKANAGTTPQSFAIEDKSRCLTEVRGASIVPHAVPITAISAGRYG